MHSVTTNIKVALARQREDFAVAFKDITTGKKFAINGHTFFHAAITMKTPVLIEVNKHAAQGKFPLVDSVVLKNEFKSIEDGSQYILDSTDDSEHELYKHIGEKKPSATCYII